MSIIYYPNRIPRPNTTAIERAMLKNKPSVLRGNANVNSNGMSVMVSANTPSWKVNTISLNFSSSSPKNYGWSVASGRKVVSGLNDYLWIQTQNPSSLWTKISLDEGFYTGDQLASHLKTKLDEAYTSIGTTFTVDYDNITGVFTITPSAGTIKYIESNDSQALRYRQSIAGHLFGFTATNTFSSTLVSDTPVPGLNNEATLVSETSNTSTYHYNDDGLNMHIDQALHLTSNNVSSLTIGYEVSYEEII